MNNKVNPTEARNLALCFFGSTDTKITPKEMAKTVNQAKTLLKKYSFIDLKDAIEYYTTINQPKEKMYSIGFLHHNMGDFFDYKYRKVQEDINNLNVEPKSRGEIVGEHKEDISTRIREKYNFSLFEK